MWASSIFLCELTGKYDKTNWFHSVPVAEYTPTLILYPKECNTKPRLFKIFLMDVIKERKVTVSDNILFSASTVLGGLLGIAGKSIEEYDFVYRLLE